MDNAKIAERLRELRGDLSREAAAEALGISVSALAMYERGERIPRDEIKLRISSLYEKSVEEIFYA